MPDAPDQNPLDQAGHRPDPAGAKRGIGSKQIIGGIVTIAIVVLVFVGIFPRIADYGEVWATIRAMTGLEVASLIVVSIWNVLSYLPVLVSCLPGLRLREAFVVTNATTDLSIT
ncbi:MAG: hypothetical protein WEA54_03160, partial [Actinomycetota bacterium]